MPEKQNNTEKSIKEKVAVSPAEIWGKVITELRDRDLKLLFIACGEISNVEVKDNLFIITTEETNKVIIDVPENLSILKEIISQYLPQCEVVVKELIYEETEISMEAKLNELFGNKLIFD